MLAVQQAEASDNTGSASHTWRPHYTKIWDWPPADRQLWDIACQPALLLENGGNAAALSAESRQKITKGYGCWINFLIHNGWLDGKRCVCLFGLGEIYGCTRLSCFTRCF
jgi:hypothetical protein